MLTVVQLIMLGCLEKIKMEEVDLVPRNVTGMECQHERGKGEMKAK